MKIKTIFFLFFLAFSGVAQEMSATLDSTAISTYPLDRILIGERLKALQREIPLNYTEATHHYINFFVNTERGRAFTKRVLERLPIYFPQFEKRLAFHKVPDELKYLAVIESGLETKIRSYAGAVGLWQFMPMTATQEYGLRVDNYIDERMDVEKSTDAACQYLKRLHKMFEDDWELALASYNTGPGNVRRAIRLSGNHSFTGIYRFIHNQTRNYVPQFVAIIYVLAHPNEYGFFYEGIEPPTFYDTITIQNYLNLEKFAELSGIPLRELKQANPSLVGTEVPDNVPYFNLKLPRTKSLIALNNLNDILAQSSTKPLKYYPKQIANEIDSNVSKEDIAQSESKNAYYRVNSQEGLISIARKFNIPVEKLKEWNNLSSNALFIGQRLKVQLPEKFTPEGNNKIVIVDNTRIKKSSVQVSKKIHRVNQGDTIWNISRRYAVTIKQLKKLNRITGNSLRLGAILRLN